MALKRRNKKSKTTSAASSKTNGHSRTLPSVQNNTQKKQSQPVAPATAATVPIQSHSRPPLYRSGAHELPSLYHETYLRVLPRDPYLVFSYWEMAGNALDEVRKTASPPLLRLYATTSGAGKQRETMVGDILITQGTYSQYVRVPEPGQRYRIEYGITTPNGDFVPFCSSNPVDVPAACVHEAIAETVFKADTGKLIDYSSRASVPPARSPKETINTGAGGADMTDLCAVGIGAAGSSWGG